ncbi:MAG: ATP-dependent DNA helicase RecG [Eubacterium sp.]|nr:ATP-dependent DNA helicase RecG [Eubacterium sp.]
MLENPIDDINGVGSKSTEEFHKMKINTHKDLLEHFPIRYEYYPEPVPAKDFFPAKTAAIRLVLKTMPLPARTGNGHYIRLRFEQHTLMLIWFHNPYINRLLSLNHEYIFRGTISMNADGTYIMSSPAFYTPEQYIVCQGNYEPVYRQTKNLRTGRIQKAIHEIRDEIPFLEDLTPEGFRRQFSLMPYAKAVEALHFPLSKKMIQDARRSICMMELYGYLYQVHQMKKKDQTVFRIGAVQQVSLPFSLTKDQQDTWEQIQADFRTGYQMRRLVQGDVGTGKSMIAFLSMIAMAQNGYQSVLLAPTEILAQQHYDSLYRLLEINKLQQLYQPVLLTGSTQKKESVYQKIMNGTARMIIGTHAVLNEKLQFHALGLVITDEQHRFGVAQRNALASYGYAQDIRPHILAMSATPIPRTLSGILYGDMDISIIRSKPEGRKPVKNCLISDKKRAAGWSFINKEVKKGRQAYIVCSMVDENEHHLVSVTQYKGQLASVFPEIRSGLLFGSMAPNEKESIMQQFKDGTLDVLISTTVIEVGVNVPNATVMMIENAERFGLAQLHQLRGRIGRGCEQSYCIFVQGDGKEESERLDFIAHTNDGFLIAEKDLALRGAGDLTGTMQSGHKKFRIADIYTDVDYINQINEYLNKEGIEHAE